MLKSEARRAVDNFNEQLQNQSQHTIKLLWEYLTNITDQTSAAVRTRLRLVFPLFHNKGRLPSFLSSKIEQFQRFSRINLVY